ncbi:hypothetical protein [Streptomyces sp. NPDC020917]|uniref:hypothetical protein n=1 Tax=Streptomyces sp. NPDC020917 TaxID=3365102 RepID=UPI0037B7AAE8
MTFRVVPGTGLVLPANAGVLRFGMTERAAQWTASTLADVRAAGWMCGAHWTFFFAHHDVMVTAHACTACAERTLGHLDVERTERVPNRAADVPVAFGDVDLFGYPIHELAEVLAPPDRGLLLPADVNPRSTHYLPAVRLAACAGGRR